MSTLVALYLFLTSLGAAKTYTTSLGADVECNVKATTDSHTENVVNCYGIPFAKPPINELRFKYPVEMTKFTDVNPEFVAPTWDATQKRNGCLQSLKGQRVYRTPDYDFDSPEYAGVLQSEDCLYLNIFRPNNDNTVPIMVWFHGGNFRWGYSAADIYDGSELATNGVMVITVSYRLDIFGSLYIGGSSDIKGNQNYMDIKMALQWIQDNIADFHGDKNRVTVFGESAGAQFVLTLMSDHSTNGLLHRVISQSAPIGIPYRTPTTWAAYTDSFCANTDCFNIKITVHSLKNVQKGGGFTTEKSDPDPQVEVIAFVKNAATKKEYSYIVGMTPWMADNRNPVFTQDNVFPICQYIEFIQFKVYDKHSKDAAAANKGVFLGSTPKIKLGPHGGEKRIDITRITKLLKRRKSTGTLHFSYKYSSESIEECLRALPSFGIGKASWTMEADLGAGDIPTAVYHTMEPMTPTIDGVMLKHQPYSAVRHGLVRKDIDVIMGVTEDEAAVFIYSALPHPVKGGVWLQTWKLMIAERQMQNVCNEQFNAYFACGGHRKYCSPRLTYNCVVYGLLGEKNDMLSGSTFSKLKQKIVGTKTDWDCPTKEEAKALETENKMMGKYEKYRKGVQEMDCRDKLEKIVESILFNLPVYLAGEKLVKNNVYLYQFDVAALYTHSQDAQSNPVYPALARESCVNDGASCHGTELPFLFYSKLEALKITDVAFNQYSDEEKKLIEAMQTFWTNFAKTGDPQNGWKNYHENKEIFKFWYRKPDSPGSQDQYKGILKKMANVEDFKKMKWWDDNLGDPWYITFGHP